MDTKSSPTQAPPADATETLKEVRRRIIGMHAAVAERVNTDPSIVPWVERELRDLMQFINASGAAPLKPRSRPPEDD